MRTLVVLLSLGLIAAGFGLAVTREVPGELVACAEVEHAMGADCSSDISKVLDWKCFLPSCDGCGCKRINYQIQGTHQPDKAQPCKTSDLCTFVQTVSSNCGS
jgi:hypothetical protein